MTESTPYEAYKATGLPWPKSIPVSWDLEKISFVFSERRETVSDKDFQPLSVTMQGIVPQLANAAKTNNGDSRKKACKGDFVINSRSDRKGSAGISPLDGSISVINTVLKPRSRVHGDFIGYLLTNYNFKEEFYRYGKGIVADLWSTKFSSMKQIWIPIPPLSEQKAIAEFLDHKTARIDTAIAKKQQLIGFLHEQKQGVINKAITQGLKDTTGHWERKKLKYVAQINPSKRNEMSDTEEVVFLPMERISEKGDVDNTIKKTVGETKTGYTYFKKGDVILAKITPCFENGKAAYLDNLETENGFGSTEFHVLRPLKKIFPQFLFCIIHSEHFRSLGEYFMVGSAGQKRVPTSFVANFSIKIPPLSEQAEIVAHIEAENQKTDTTVSRIEQEIELLKEYRTTLIASAVTGKINVLEKAYALQD